LISNKLISAPDPVRIRRKPIHESPDPCYGYEHYFEYGSVPVEVPHHYAVPVHQNPGGTDLHYLAQDYAN
jgi:hypothetical protein